MKKLFTVLVVAMSMFMLFSCGSKEVCEDTPAPVADDAAVVADEAAVVAEDAAVVADVPEVVEEANAWVSDSVWVKYMIQPNDYLTKIAVKEYGMVSMWRDIWTWNEETIGDNPDLIYPYEELDLKKAAGTDEPKECSFEDYTVKEHESLWEIAEKVYGNNYAWVVLVRDNMEVLGDDYDSITEGTVLKIRTDLY